MTYDLGSGKYTQGPPEAVGTSGLGADPLAKMESYMRVAVIAAAFALLILSFAGVLAVLF